jgi:phytoene synthase
MDHAALADELPPLLRLALAYAPSRARPASLLVFALDQRLGAIVRATREPLLGQARLAWWRERLLEPPELWPAGEPVLAALRTCAGMAPHLVELVDGWEALLVSDDPAHGVADLVQGRAKACAALADLLGHTRFAEAAHSAGRNWALADLVLHLSATGGRGFALAELQSRSFDRVRLPRDLRPLEILSALAKRVSTEPDVNPNQNVAAFLQIIRIGLFGR